MVISIRKNEKPRIKGLIIALVMCLGLYPVAELTRVVWTISYAYDPGRLSTWVAETIIMWILYLLIIPIMHFAIRWLSVEKA